MIEGLLTAVHLMRAEPLVEPIRYRARYYHRVKRKPPDPPKLAPFEQNVILPEEPIDPAIVDPPYKVLSVTLDKASFEQRWWPFNTDVPTKGDRLDTTSREVQ